MEVADLLIVNKTDGNLPVARNTAADYKGASHFLRFRMNGWDAPPIYFAYKLEDMWWLFVEVWEVNCKGVG